MKTMGRAGAGSRRRAAGAVALGVTALVLTACSLTGGGSTGGGQESSTRSDDPIVGTTTPSAPVPAQLDETQALVAQTVTDYNAALARGDWNGACSLMAGDAQQRLVQRVQERAPEGTQVPGCPEALTLVLTQAGAQQTAVEASTGPVIEAVEISGTDATVTWSATRSGLSVRTENTLRLENTRWLLVGTAG